MWGLLLATGLSSLLGYLDNRANRQAVEKVNQQTSDDYRHYLQAWTAARNEQLGELNPLLHRISGVPSGLDLRRFPGAFGARAQLPPDTFAPPQTGSSAGQAAALVMMLLPLLMQQRGRGGSSAAARAPITGGYGSHTL